MVTLVRSLLPIMFPYMLAIFNEVSKLFLFINDGSETPFRLFLTTRYSPVVGPATRQILLKLNAVLAARNIE